MVKLGRHVKKHFSALQKDIFKQMLTLATSGFGLVAALAWNELIKEIVTKYIQPVAGVNSGLISLLVYAVIVTLLAVFVTYSLTKLVKKN
ncbi:MAG TPA: DUF5654 family protein [Patescibacteria group bacterium]|nr:DUF5654 family protein [Patescibacteria group bacterium]